MPETLYDVELWRRHADEARALSKTIADPQTRSQILTVAAGFEHIAQLAGQLASASKHTKKWRPVSAMRAR